MIYFTVVAVILASVASKALAESGNPVYPWPAVTDSGVNIAFGKDASQSSTYCETPVIGCCSADRAVDGTINQHFLDEPFSMSHTNDELGAWWKVNLEKVYPISAVKIYNRLQDNDCTGDCIEGMKYFSVDLLDSSDNIVASKRLPKSQSWRIMATESYLPGLGGAWDVSELNFYADYTCTNKLTLESYINSKYYPLGGTNGIPAAAFDGNESTIWAGRKSDLDNLFWIGAKFENEVEIKCVQFLDGKYGMFANGVNTVEIQMEDDSGNWNTVEMAKNLQTGTRHDIMIGSNSVFTFDFENIDASQVRIIFDSNYKSAVQMAEVEVFTPNFDFKHWDIKTIDTALVNEGPMIKVEFNISNRDHSTKLLQSDCENNFTGLAEKSISSDDIALTSSGEFVEYNTMIKINHNAFVNNSTYWTNISDTMGFMEVCVLTELYLTDTTETVNFVSNLINVTFDTDGNFKVSNINVTRTGPEESEVAVDYSTYLDAYQCLPDNLTEKNTRVYNQGSVLVVCVKGDGNIVAVETIKQLSVTQGTEPSFEYISENNGYNAAIVQVKCQDDNSNRICSAQLRLLGRFFTSDSPENLKVTGSVTMTFPSNRRHLSHATFVQGRYNDLEGSRYLEDISNTGAFNIDAKLEKIEDVGVSQTILSGNMNYHLSQVALYYVVGILLYTM